MSGKDYYRKYTDGIEQYDPDDETWDVGVYILYFYDLVVTQVQRFQILHVGKVANIANILILKVDMFKLTEVSIH